MRYAIKFDQVNGWPNYMPYEQWLIKRLGHHNWGRSGDWMSGWPSVYGARNYYIAVKDPSILTMMALALGDLGEYKV